MKIKYYIEFANISEVSIKNFHEQMNLLKNYEFVVVFVDACYEKK